MRKEWMRRAAAGLALGLAAVPAVAATQTPAAQAAATCPATTLAVVAHQDDDLLFMNPDLTNDYESGRCLQITYVTAGDGGRAASSYYVASREDGVRDAYKTPAASASTWQDSTATYDGRTVSTSTLTTGSKSIQLTFLRLPDGFPEGGGSAERGNQSLLKLFKGDLGTIWPVDYRNGYSEGALLDTLAAIIRSIKPTTLRTLDPVGTQLGYSTSSAVDHSDHLMVGRYVAQALGRAKQADASVNPELVSYRGYSMSTFGSNLSATQTQRKTDIFNAYVRHEGCQPNACPTTVGSLQSDYANWVTKQHVRSVPAVPAGAILSRIGGTSAPNTDANSTRCLDVAGGASGTGAVQTYPCNSTAAQKWSLNGAAVVTGLDGRCLAVEGSSVAVRACTGAASQQWAKTASGGLRNAAGRCLQQDDLIVGESEPYLAGCVPGLPEQEWRGL